MPKDIVGDLDTSEESFVSRRKNESNRESTLAYDLNKKARIKAQFKPRSWHKLHSNHEYNKESARTFDYGESSFDGSDSDSVERKLVVESDNEKT